MSIHPDDIWGPILGIVFVLLLILMVYLFVVAGVGSGLPSPHETPKLQKGANG